MVRQPLNSRIDWNKPGLSRRRSRDSSSARSCRSASTSVGRFPIAASMEVYVVGGEVEATVGTNDCHNRKRSRVRASDQRWWEVEEILRKIGEIANSDA